MAADSPSNGRRTSFAWPNSCARTDTISTTLMSGGQARPKCPTKPVKNRVSSPFSTFNGTTSFASLTRQNGAVNATPVHL
ncbi:hypothetical protein KSP40_PGU013985 [Platanthera guangdongensis]|uniref:Uncharacterized protein n=1 Tax=Platanthera guangdongensis TaxID=2320717 RepID=A0ABR2MWB2_9ASPA